MQISGKEILFIYNSNDLQDRQALGYAKSLPGHIIKEVDLQKDRFTETQVKQIADMLDVEPVSLLNQGSDLYKRSYSDVELSRSGALKAMASEPELIKTPIAVYNDRAVPINSPYQLIKKDLENFPSIEDYSSPPNDLNIVHDPDRQRFSADLGEKQMVLKYVRVSPEVIDFTYTYVPEEFRNQGFGGKLVSVGMEYAVDEEMKVKASCPFVSDFAEDHPRYRRLLVD